jgi:transposase-like protein
VLGERDFLRAVPVERQSYDQNGLPETVTIDGSSANLAALEAIDAEFETPIKVRQTKYLNNIQDHRAGPPGDQTAHTAYAGVQGFSLCPHHSEWH